MTKKKKKAAKAKAAGWNKGKSYHRYNEQAECRTCGYVRPAKRTKRVECPQGLPV